MLALGSLSEVSCYGWGVGNQSEPLPPRRPESPGEEVVLRTTGGGVGRGHLERGCDLWSRDTPGPGKEAQQGGVGGTDLSHSLHFPPLPAS